MSPDVLNAVFELTGAALTAMNARQVYRDRGYAGITIPACLFFFSWGAWNLFYYPHLGQWWSAAAGACLFTANLTWLSMMVYYGKVQR